MHMTPKQVQNMTTISIISYIGFEKENMAYEF